MSMKSSRFIQFWRHITFKTIWKTIQRAAQNRLPGLAAEMAYNAMLALFPGILAVITAIGLFQPLTRTFNELVGQLSEVAPLEAMTIIQEFANDISGSRDRGLFSVSFAIALWASSGALSAAMTALDQIHQIPPREMRPFWKAKFISLCLTMGTIALLVVALTLVFVSDIIVRQIAMQSDVIKPWVLMVWRLLSFPLALWIMSITIGFIYRFGPSRWSPGKPIMPGAILAAVFWAVLSNLFRLYVANFGDYNRAYGAVGAVIILLLWLYLSSLVLLIADQLNVTVGEVMEPPRQHRPISERLPLRLRRIRPGRNVQREMDK